MSSQQLHDGTWTHTFRQSFLGTIQKCPEMARAEYFGEVEQELEDTDSQALGTSVHAGIEYALYEKRDNKQPELDDIIDVALEQLRQLHPWQQTKLSEERVFALVPMLCAVWYGHVLDLVEPMLLEQYFKLPFYEDEQRRINLAGTIDCIDKNASDWDWKTSSRPWDAWEKQRWSVQATTYTWATHMLASSADGYVGDMPPAIFTNAVLLHNGDVQFVEVWRTQGHVDWLLQQCLQVARLIESGVKPWPLNDGGWWCSETWCPKFAECKGLYVPENWKAAA